MQDDLKLTLQQMDEYDFEKFIADLWEDQGWSTRVLQASKDKGIDIEARRSDPIDQKLIIQAKRYSSGNKVGSEQVQQYSSLKIQEDHVDTVVIITTTEFTKQARNLATELNIKLVNGDDLVQIIQEQDAQDILDRYVGSETPEVDHVEPEKNLSHSADTVDLDNVPKMYVRKLLDDAIGNLVTLNRLTQLKSGLSHPQTPTEQPILGHLYEGEQPHFTLRFNKLVTPEGEKSPPNNGYLVVTDQRILVIQGMEDGDKDINIPYRSIQDIDVDKHLSFYKFIINSRKGDFEFHVNHNVFNESQADSKEDIKMEIMRCAKFIRETVFSQM